MLLVPAGKRTPPRAAAAIGLRAALTALGVTQTRSIPRPTRLINAGRSSCLASASAVVPAGL
jgi:hypothetical protein